MENPINLLRHEADKGNKKIELYGCCKIYNTFMIYYKWR